ncbi:MULTISPECIES: hypothetical protein [unclassified Brevundimonas]|uniref:hypothetical protein n=1 Tax=unclassified Brevundimonas TaxID=2622653 RepID=UPI000CFAB2F8|nr:MULTISPECIES: hypothetical protein [unclassified Brevundimonas]PRA26650.1 hypothetical protein CQ024_12605 [Brevundimonas sp. MYb27]PQZ76327.1 hypothetical protein CQ026_14120 [Brevundimonas sp. MYb31]PRB12151.1 hypothetical protein CQ039_14920 [Brevundimonas sp. MYb52]PRB33054.1 hypothetical protein CQ035_14430 [Brevundimonas sp. MYb46]PRB45954.1 hypothetical protein CQ028_12195 [Brevundimonas sp. MYb33]
MRPALAASLLALTAALLTGCGQPAPAEPPQPAGVDTRLSQEPIDAVPLKDAPAPVSPPKPKPDLKPEAVAPEPEPTKTETPAVTPVGEPGSCLAEIGEARSKRLVERCIAVSPATRPPCNSANPCDMIQGEIDRSCAMYGADEAKPKECAN